VIIFGLIFEAALPQMTSLWPAEMIQNMLIKTHLESLPVAISGYHEPSIVFNVGTETKLTDFNGVINHASNLAESVAIVPLDQADLLQEELTGKASSQMVGKVTGINYSKGKVVQLALIHTARSPKSKPRSRP
jgi:hypothetical protein